MRALQSLAEDIAAEQAAALAANAEAVHAAIAAQTAAAEANARKHKKALDKADGFQFKRKRTLLQQVLPSTLKGTALQWLPECLVLAKNFQKKSGNFRKIQEIFRIPRVHPVAPVAK